MRQGMMLCALGLYLAAGHMAVAQSPPDAPDEQAELTGQNAATERTEAAEQDALDEPAEPTTPDGLDEPPELDGATYGPTTPDETLWSIAREVRPPGATLDGTVAALQRMNPHAFVLGDPDVLMKDVFLKVPTTVAETEIAPDAEALGAPAEALAAGEETVPEGDTPEPAVGDTAGELLETRNTELQARLTATRRELASATARVEALEGQVSTLRRQLAESEARTPDWQSSVARIVEVTRRNSVTVTALTALLLVMLSIVFAGNRSKRRAAAQQQEEQEQPEEPERRATRVGTRQPVPESAPRDTDTDHAQYAPGTKLNLARAFIDMGRADQAREVLEEVLAEGSEAEQREADELLGQME